jgi:hypothetical protein
MRIPSHLASEHAMFFVLHTCMQAATVNTAQIHVVLIQGCCGNAFPACTHATGRVLYQTTEPSPSPDGNTTDTGATGSPAADPSPSPSPQVVVEDVGLTGNPPAGESPSPTPGANETSPSPGGSPPLADETGFTGPPLTSSG